MRSLIYSLQVSLDGYISDRDGSIDALAPDDEVHRFHNEQAREIGVYLLGRRLHETMVYWDRAAEDPALGEAEREFAELWMAARKLVVSDTLEAAEGDAELLTGDLAEEVARLKATDGGEIGVGGAGLAASLIELGLVDEYRPVTYPVVLGGGTPYLPPLDSSIELELAETRTFGSGVVYSRYLAAG